jgi:predicted ferric reductase
MLANMIGPVLVAIPCVIAAWLAVTTLAPYGIENVFSIAVGAVSIVAMSQIFILTAFPRHLEPLFGGLDRMYVVHKWLGIVALALMAAHDMVEPELERWARETNLGEFAEELGEIAYYGFIGLVLVSWIKRLPFVDIEIPWQIWRFSHRFMGVLFALAAFHLVFIDSPIPRDAPFTIYMNAACAVGLLAYGYTERIARRLRRRFYRVTEITHKGSTAQITLAPQGRPMIWRPGQFAFLSAPAIGMGESHPFTITNTPQADGTLRFAIKSLGDWTRALPCTLRVGAGVHIEGPYGRFDFRKGSSRQVWLAGGVGITPFLAWAESLTGAETRTIHLFYSVAKLEEAIGLEVLTAAAARNPHFTFDMIASDREGRLTAARMISDAPFPIRGSDLYFCGPSGLKDCVLHDLNAHGQAPRRVFFERFEFR